MYMHVFRYMYTLYTYAPLFHICLTVYVCIRIYMYIYIYITCNTTTPLHNAAHCNNSFVMRLA